MAKTVIDSLPVAPDLQCLEIRVVFAVAAYLAWGDGTPSAGAELDLAKAYDSILREPAAEAEAFRFEGTPREVIAWLEHAWTAKRICNVGPRLFWPPRPLSKLSISSTM